MIPHGIKDNHLQHIKQILSDNCKNIEKVCLFGSRAIGNYRETSDIDLVLYGSITEQENDRLYTCFHESTLPYKIDIITYHHIRHKPLKRQIDETALLLFNEEQLYNEQEVI